MVCSAVESLSLKTVTHQTSGLIVVCGTLDGRRCRDMLVDTGASSSFIRRDWALSHRLPVRELSSPLDVTLANGTLAGRLTGVVVAKSLDSQGSSAQEKLLVMDELSHHVILGMPWLTRAGVDLRLGDPCTWNGKPLLHVDVRGGKGRVLQSMTIASGFEGTMARLLRKYSDVFSAQLRRRSPEAEQRSIKCTLRLKDKNCRPVVCRERRRSPADTLTMKGQTREMLDAGLIRPSVSPWSSQVLLVKKVRDGVELPEKRMCIDLRQVNDLIESDAYALPLPEDLFDKLTGCRVFSKLDLTKGFWQIPMDEASRALLAFSTPEGLMEPLKMPFGMKNAPAVFQREMQRVLSERLHSGVVVFVDDILIYSKTAEEHEELVEFVLRRLKEESYLANPDKCEFFQKEISFLGHVVSERGMSVQQHKVKSVSDWPVPQTRKHVRSFLGLTGYYRKFIRAYSEIAAPLTDLTRKDKKFEWTAREQKAFDMLKERLSTADVLAHPDPKRPYEVMTDASDFAISGVLSQKQDDGTTRPIAFYSAKMNDAERRYATHEKELLGLIRAVEHWRCYLEGNEHPIILLSDHRSLQHLSTQPKLSARQARWVEKLSEFEFIIRYMPGELNVVADRLSRRPDLYPVPESGQAEEDEDEEANQHEVKEVQPRIKLRLGTIEEVKPQPQWMVKITSLPLREEMKAAAQADPDYVKMLNEPEPRTDGRIVGDGLVWTCDGLCYVPNSRELQRRLMHEVHDTPTGGHMGFNKTWARLSSTCWWPRMRAMIQDYVRGCLTCAATKPDQRKPAGLLHPLPIPERPWQVMSMDFVGPLPRTPDHYDTVLVVIDKFSKEGHLIPTTQHANAKSTAKLLIDHVVRLHGIPEAIISDRGTQFTAKLFRKVWEQLGTELRFSTAYHPQSDGQTERLNRDIEQQLRWHADKTGSNWKEWLSVVEMQYNSTVHSSTGKTPYEMNGTNWRDPFTMALQKPSEVSGDGSAMSTDGAEDLLRDVRITWEDARQVMLKQREQQKKYADRKRRDERYEVGDLVMLSTKNLAQRRGKLADRYAGPFRVAEVKENGVNVRLDLPAEFSRIHSMFHVDKLKRFTESRMEWPGRQQVERPPPVLVDGAEQYWAKRILSKRTVEKEVLVSEPVSQSKSKEEIKDSDEKAVVSQPTAGRRISPRDHASTRSAAQPPPPVTHPLAGKPRNKKVKQTVTEFLVEWEGYDLLDATWEPEENLLKSNCHELINDYYTRQMDDMDYDENDQLELATMFTVSTTVGEDGIVNVNCVRV
jgi:transposase InsO family protein